MLTGLPLDRYPVITSSAQRYSVSGVLHQKEGPPKLQQVLGNSLPAVLSVVREHIVPDTPITVGWDTLTPEGWQRAKTLPVTLDMLAKDYPVAGSVLGEVIPLMSQAMLDDMEHDALQRELEAEAGASTPVDVEATPHRPEGACIKPVHVRPVGSGAKLVPDDGIECGKQGYIDEVMVRYTVGTQHGHRLQLDTKQCLQLAYKDQKRGEDAARQTTRELDHAQRVLFSLGDSDPVAVDQCKRAIRLHWQAHMRIKEQAHRVRVLQTIAGLWNVFEALDSYELADVIDQWEAFYHETTVKLRSIHEEGMRKLTHAGIPPKDWRTPYQIALRGECASENEELAALARRDRAAVALQQTQKGEKDPNTTSNGKRLYSVAPVSRVEGSLRCDSAYTVQADTEEQAITMVEDSVQHVGKGGVHWFVTRITIPEDWEDASTQVKE